MLYQYERLRTRVTRSRYVAPAHAYRDTVLYHAMSVNIDLRVYTGNNVLLPGSQVPRPATVLVSTKTGKINDVREGRQVRADYADIIASSSDDDRWTDIGDKYLLPGLVEYVRSSSRLVLCTRPSMCHSSQPCPRVSPLVRMCTLTSLGGRIGRASGRALVRLRPEA